MGTQKKSPEVRFEGFTVDWKDEQLKHLGHFLKGNGYSKSDIRKSGHPIILYGRLYTNYNLLIDNVDTFTEPKEGSIYSEGGEVLIPSSGESAEDIIIASVVKNEQVILGGDLNIIRPKENLNSEFLALSISNGLVYKELVKKAQGKSVVHIRNSDLQETYLPYPDIYEQEKIADLFLNLNKLITNHQTQLTKLKNLKKAMLTKMFPQNGASVPEIRFKGFEGEWVEKELGEVAPVRGGFAFKSFAFKKEGISILKISNILVSGEVGGSFDFYQEQENDTNMVLPNKAAVIAMSGATTGKVSILKIPDDKKVYQNQRVGYFENKEIVDYSFISVLVTSELFSLKMISVLVAGAQPNVSPKDINSFMFLFPKSNDEQQKIGYFFENLNKLIKNHQEQLNKLNNIKKACLNKLFVS